MYHSKETTKTKFTPHIKYRARQNKIPENGFCVKKKNHLPEDNVSSKYQDKLLKHNYFSWRLFALISLYYGAPDNSLIILLQKCTSVISLPKYNPAINYIEGYTSQLGAFWSLVEEVIIQKSTRHQSIIT